MEELAFRIEAVLLVSLRIVPTLAFAPPFTLLRLPVPIRLLLALALAMALVAGNPEAALGALRQGQSLLSLASGELLVGVAISLALQIAFSAIQWAGGAADIQAGFGLATIADPTTQAQMPLAGTVFSYAAALIFFTSGGPYDLLALWSASLEALPVGHGVRSGDMAALGALLGSAFAIAMGLFALVMLVLFLLDLAIAFMSRTLPQMNMLLLGFQVKSLAMLVALPVALALSTSLSLRLLRLALESAPRLLWAGG
ncbi:MAG TPA: flagellar biosynthetic protein FliR [Sphingomonadaceae bacterium]|nr:flagellar biosynthetic protein FliR [Sphingomonadaceae bacterium]